MIQEEAFLKDFRAGRNAEEACQLKWWVLHRLKTKGPCTADDIYEESGCGDIAMCLTLHELVNNKLIKGMSPYDDSMRGTKHTDWHYELNSDDPMGAVSFFSGVAGAMAQNWNPEEWADGTVLPGDSTVN